MKLFFGGTSRNQYLVKSLMFNGIASPWARESKVEGDVNVNKMNNNIIIIFVAESTPSCVLISPIFGK